VDNINENIEIAKNENENDNITENFFFIFWRKLLRNHTQKWITKT
jgi:hypothetical protein